METRIKLDMSVIDILAAMAGGNPGAATALCEILEYGPSIDPESAQLMAILWLDAWGIYEERIYMLWNDVCGRDVGKMLAVIRACQLGQLGGATREAINHAIDNRGAGLDLDAIIDAVRERLPRFNPAWHEDWKPESVEPIIDI